MSDAKYTPGPWKLHPHRRDGARHGGFWIASPDSHDFVRVYRDTRHWPGEPVETTEANAYIISAAPEQNQALLDAPEMDCWPDMTRDELERVLEGYVKWFHGQRADALSKAEVIRPAHHPSSSQSQ